VSKRSAVRIADLVPFALSVLLTILAAPSVHAQTVAGSITALNGSANITRGPRTFPAAYSAPINVGDRLDTSATGRLTITLTDSSQLEMTESSTLLISEDLLNPNGTRNRTVVTLLSGLVRSLVRVSAGTAPNYEVHTPNAVASARGTTYDTYYTNKGSRPGFNGCKEFSDVLDYDGIVAVSSLANPTSPTIELRSGQKTTIPCGLAVLPAAALSAIGPGTAAGGAGLGTVAAASAGGVAIVSGGVVGGVAGAGGLSSSSPPPPAQKTSITPSM
jgi:hypothetical protein